MHFCTHTHTHTHTLQYETQNESLHASLCMSDLKKQELESKLGTLHDELLTLRGREQVLLSAEYDREQEQAGLLHSANQVQYNNASFSLSLGGVCVRARTIAFSWLQQEEAWAIKFTKCHICRYITFTECVYTQVYGIPHRMCSQQF